MSIKLRNLQIFQLSHSSRSIFHPRFIAFSVVDQDPHDIIAFFPLQLPAPVLVHDHKITMSGQNAPSPAQRSASTGPNAPLTTPTAAPLVNGVASGPVAGAPAPAPTAGSSAGSGMSQQNLNQIVSRPPPRFPPFSMIASRQIREDSRETRRDISQTDGK